MRGGCRRPVKTHLSNQDHEGCECRILVGIFLNGQHVAGSHETHQLQSGGSTRTLLGEMEFFTIDVFVATGLGHQRVPGAEERSVWYVIC